MKNHGQGFGEPGRKVIRTIRGELEIFHGIDLFKLVPPWCHQPRAKGRVPIGNRHIRLRVDAAPGNDFPLFKGIVTPQGVSPGPNLGGEVLLPEPRPEGRVSFRREVQ